MTLLSIKVRPGPLKVNFGELLDDFYWTGTIPVTKQTASKDFLIHTVCTEMAKIHVTLKH